MTVTSLEITNTASRATIPMVVHPCTTPPEVAGPQLDHPRPLPPPSLRSIPRGDRGRSHLGAPVLHPPAGPSDPHRRTPGARATQEAEVIQRHVCPSHTTTLSLTKIPPVFDEPTHIPQSTPRPASRAIQPRLPFFFLTRPPYQPLLSDLHIPLHPTFIAPALPRTVPTTKLVCWEWVPA